MHEKRQRVVLTTVFLAALALLACSRGRPDAQIVAAVQSALHADTALAPASIGVQSANGVVVLTGNVANEAQRSTAEIAARQVQGVKSIINNLQVAQAAAPVARPTGGAKLTPRAKGKRPATPAAAPAPAATAVSTPAPSVTPAAPLPPPEPVKVTIPEGTAVSIRLIDPVDTAKNQAGDTFRASLESPIVIADKTIIPKNADAEAKLVSAKSAGHFSGSSAVVLVLTKLAVNGKNYDVQTGEFTKQGASRGKRTATVVGGGAALGGVIGAIAGGGKGAAIGAAAGAGAGTGVQALTKGEQIKLPAETVLEFRLKAPLSVTPASSEVFRPEKAG